MAIQCGGKSESPNVHALSGGCTEQHCLLVQLSHYGQVHFLAVSSNTLQCLLLILLFKKTLKHSAELLPIASKCKVDMMCLTEKNENVLDKLQRGNSVLGQEFKI